MKKLDIYIIRQFLSTLGMTLLGFVSVILIVDLIENLDRFIDNAIPAGITIKYYIYAIPWFINIGLPMSMLISSLKKPVLFLNGALQLRDLAMSR